MSENKEYINIQTGEVLDIERVAGLKDNAILKVRPEMWIEWDFKKNDESGFDIWKLSKGSEKVICLICKNCGHPRSKRVDSAIKGGRCKKCGWGSKLREINLESEYPSLIKEWNFNKNDLSPVNYTPKANQKVWWVCNKGHEWETYIYNRTNNKSGCPYCSGLKAWRGETDMWTTNPLLASLLLNPEDGYEYTQNSNQKVDWKCSCCEEIIKQRVICDINNQGLPCPKCKDRMSFGERLMYYLLKSLDIEFVFDRKTKWSNNRKYDFYIPSLNLIIETHGIQHYIQTNRKGARSLEEEQANDKLKEKLAKENSIEHYIVIDCRHSNLDFIKRNIMESGIRFLVDLSHIRWDEVYKKSLQTITNTIVNLYTEGLTLGEIANTTGFGEVTIKNQLLTAFELGLCKRRIGDEKLFIKIRKQVVQLDIDLNYIRTWDSVRNATITVTGHASGKISSACKKLNSTVHGYKWMYKEDYDRYIKEQNKMA